MTREELHALIDTIGPNKAVGRMAAARLPLEEVDEILREHPDYGYAPISDRMITALLGSVRRRRRPRPLYGPDPFQRHM